MGGLFGLGDANVFEARIGRDFLRLVGLAFLLDWPHWGETHSDERRHGLMFQSRANRKIPNGSIHWIRTSD